MRKSEQLKAFLAVIGYPFFHLAIHLVSFHYFNMDMPKSGKYFPIAVNIMEEISLLRWMHAFIFLSYIIEGYLSRDKS